MLLTSTGATIDHAIEAAVETPDADIGFYGLMALIGIYVGVIPVAIGMLWLPWLRRVDARWMRFLLAFTVGLLGFLGVEALLEGTEIAGEGAEAFGGAALVWLGAVGAYLALAGVDAWLRGARPRGQGRRGQGRSRASASAPRSWSRSGSASTTSARVWRSAPPTPSARSRWAPRWWWASRSTTRPRGSRSSRRLRARVRPRLRTLVLLGLLAGAPAVLGAWIGASAFDPSLAALMFGLGAGAIAQVIVQIAPAIRGDDGPAAPSARDRRAADRAARDVRDRAAGERLMAVRSEVSGAVQDYAKAIWSLGAARRPPVSTSAIAERLEVSPASASAMVKRLESMGLVSTSLITGWSSARPASAWLWRCCATTGCSRLSGGGPRRAVGPGPQGGRGAGARDLAGALGADRREARPSDARSPRGSDPDRRRRDRGGAHRRARRAGAGRGGVFVRVSDSDPAMLRYLAERGISPGERFEVVERSRSRAR